MSERSVVRASFIPLLDAAILIVAARRGFAEAEGIDLALVRETSWANIRDRVAIGHFDVAHMLAPMPIAASLGLTPLKSELIAPMALGLGGNAITVSNSLWQAMREKGSGSGGDPAATGLALRSVIEARKRSGAAPLTFAVVHAFSGHNFELRYWLAASGIAPDHDIELTVVPPPYMVDALKSERIDGYCVGEPWSSSAVIAGVGKIVTTKSAIWRSSPEKVLGMRADWAANAPETVAQLLRALHRASLWCDDPQNHAALAALLSEPDLLGLPPHVLLPGLTNRIALGDGPATLVSDFLFFSRRAATFPWVSHALWFFSQMVRWRQANFSPEAVAIARRTYRPDIYRAALAPLGVALPSASAKVEGALTHETPVASSTGRLQLGPDGFFNGRTFDPDLIEQYIRDFDDR
jgi:two-component system, oxyanion-binding sensor